MLTRLQFPSKEIITAYLTNHPYTKNLIATETKIIDAVADFFANQKKPPHLVKQDVKKVISETNEDLMVFQELILFALMESAQILQAKL